MIDSPALAHVRRQLARITPRRREGIGRVGFGHRDIDAALGGGIARGRLHEFFADDDDVASGAGIVALLGLRAAAGRAILWLRTDGAERRGGRLQATGLGEMGVPPALLLLAVVPDEKALLKAAADAARCAGLGALLVEWPGAGCALDLTASRRLMLAAEASGIMLLVLRTGAAPAPSAADTRWRVAAAPSAALEANAPGAPAFDLELVRRRAGAPAGPWRVEWNREGSCFIDVAGARHPHGCGHAAAGRPRTPLSGAVLSLAAGRTAAADPPAPVRRTG